MKISLPDLVAMWEQDTQINSLEPDKELLKISKLHSKYLSILADHSILSKHHDNEYKKWRRIMWEYYSGDLNNPTDLATYGLEPFQKRVLKGDLNLYLDSDPKLQEILIKKQMNEDIVSHCEKIIKELNTRSYSLKAYTDWQRYMSGA